VSIDLTHRTATGSAIVGRFCIPLAVGLMRSLMGMRSSRMSCSRRARSLITIARGELSIMRWQVQLIDLYPTPGLWGSAPGQFIQSCQSDGRRRFFLSSAQCCGLRQRMAINMRW
jgi:hypothetical protein